MSYKILTVSVKIILVKINPKYIKWYIITELNPTSGLFETNVPMTHFNTPNTSSLLTFLWQLNIHSMNE